MAHPQIRTGEYMTEAGFPATVRRLRLRFGEWFYDGYFFVEGNVYAIARWSLSGVCAEDGRLNLKERVNDSDKAP